ncbi:MAG: hypothetical protein CBD54_001115 [Alphaproteobacteria bacterium TMED194]|nr:MAG: hypothetical protein CBD54_001115 [Alphaproteobacteria bacterium TMED194]|tara:strand:+ start:5547 stop:5972 length:426 start_codon:yes stop_codon:yes gene_type:complete
MAITTINTSQAPDAKPIAISKVVTTNMSVIVDCPQYNVPELVFGGSNVIEPGVAEIISPLVLCNVTANTVNVDLQMHREVENLEFFILKNMPIPAYETIPIPLNGQFLKTGDELKIEATADLAIHATISFTQGQSEEDDVV